MAKTRKEKHFEGGIISLLYNMSDSENKNHDLSEDQILYYRGILVAVVQLVMRFFDKDFYFALKYVYEFSPNNSNEIIYKSLPESWREDYGKIIYNK